MDRNRAETAWPVPGASETRRRDESVPKIWENKSDFEAKIAAFGKAVADNKDKAKTLDELKVAMPLVSKTCGDCHEPYRRPPPPAAQPGQKK